MQLSWVVFEISSHGRPGPVAETAPVAKESEFDPWSGIDHTHSQEFVRHNWKKI